VTRSSRIDSRGKVYGMEQGFECVRRVKNARADILYLDPLGRDACTWNDRLVTQSEKRHKNIKKENESEGKCVDSTRRTQRVSAQHLGLSRPQRRSWVGREQPSCASDKALIARSGQVFELNRRLPEKA